MENQKTIKGIWIPDYILADRKLKDKEKQILSIILYLSSENKYCTITNSAFAKIFDISVNRVSKIISSLKEKGYIETKLCFENGTKHILKREIIPIVKNNNGYS